jgi:hypothetical protein
MKYLRLSDFVRREVYFGSQFGFKIKGPHMMRTLLLVGPQGSTLQEKGVQAWWLTPVIPSYWRGEVGRSWR